MEEKPCPYCEGILGSEEPFCPHCRGDLRDLESQGQGRENGEPQSPKSRKRWLPGLVLVLVLMLLVGGGYFAWRYHPQSDLAALVGGEKIYWSEIDGKLQSLKGMILRDMNVDIDSPQAGQLVADLKKRILDALIQEKILLAEATRAGAKVTPEEVTARVAAIQKERALTDEAFAELLKSHGLTLEALRERVGRELLIEQAIDAGIKETRLSREEWLERVFSVARVEVFPIK